MLNHKKYNFYKQYSFDTLTSEQQKFMLDYEIQVANEQADRKRILEEQQKNEQILAEPKEKIIINKEKVKEWFEFYYKKTFSKSFEYNEENTEIMDLIFMYFARDKAFELQHESYSLDKGLALIGGCGSGKTTIMQTFSLLGQDFFKKHQSLLFFFKMSSCNKLSIEYQSDEQKRDLTNYIYGIRCFDDLGSEKNVFGDKNLMEQIMEQRYYEQFTQRKLNSKTHFTTNLSIKELKERYGDRVQDRLKEQCNFIIFKGKSFRK